MKPQLFLSAVLVQSLAAGQTSVEQEHCVEFNQLAIVGAVPNRLDQAEAAISAAVSQGKYVCAGVLLGNVAALLSIHGRIRDSEAFAARSLDLLRQNIDPDDPRLLRPLHVLATATLEQGEIRKAEQALSADVTSPGGAPGTAWADSYHGRCAAAYTGQVERS